MTIICIYLHVFENIDIMYIFLKNITSEVCALHVSACVDDVDDWTK